MTEQTAAERERRAAILRADGEKRSAILRAEGARQSRILEAEGDRQSLILRAEGERQRRILEAQGEAQGLRIVALGAKPHDRRSMTVLSLDALKAMANGQATKIIFPFEISSLMRQSAKYLGLSEEEMPPAEEGGTDGLGEEILGSIPKSEEVREILEDVARSVPETPELREKEKGFDVEPVEEIVRGEKAPYRPPGSNL
jgi:regulator of protease activity HflC (stomatin/prohibitin superfamily)